MNTETATPRFVHKLVRHPDWWEFGTDNLPFERTFVIRKPGECEAKTDFVQRNKRPQLVVHCMSQH